MRTGG